MLKTVVTLTKAWNEPLTRIIQCDGCNKPFKITDEVVVREIKKTRYRGDDDVTIYHKACAAQVKIIEAE